jgi:hypothetical protein
MHESVQDYYGKQLQSSADLKTDACCDISQVPGWLKPLLSNIHPEVSSRYYGCDWFLLGDLPSVQARSARN